METLNVINYENVSNKEIICEEKKNLKDLVAHGSFIFLAYFITLLFLFQYYFNFITTFFPLLLSFWNNYCGI